MREGSLELPIADDVKLKRDPYDTRELLTSDPGAIRHVRVPSVVHNGEGSTLSRSAENLRGCITKKPWT